MDAPLYTGFDRERSVSFRINAFSNAVRVILLYSDATRESVCVCVVFKHFGELQNYGIG